MLLWFAHTGSLGSGQVNSKAANKLSAGEVGNAHCQNYGSNQEEEDVEGCENQHLE